MQTRFPNAVNQNNPNFTEEGKFLPKEPVTYNQVKSSYGEIAPWPKITIPKWSKLYKTHRVSWYDKTDIREYYKISRLYTIQRTWPYVLAWIGIVKNLSTIKWVVTSLFGLVWIEFYSNIINYAIYGMTAILGLQIIAMLVYFELYRQTYSVVLDGFRFVVNHGVFKRQSFMPMMRDHTMFFLTQSWLDVPFGLYRIRIAGSGIQSGDDKIVTIPALNRRDAFDLFKFLMIGIDQTNMVMGGDSVKDIEDEDLDYHETFDHLR